MLSSFLCFDRQKKKTDWGACIGVASADMSNQMELLLESGETLHIETDVEAIW